MLFPLHDAAARWVSGWCLSRHLASRSWRDGWIVDVAHAETRALEYVVVDPAPDDIDALLAAAAGRPDVWVTVIGAVPDALAQELDAVTHSERFMCVALTPGPPPLGVRLEVIDDVGHARIEVDGVTAAWGQAAVVGADAVVDKIGTDPAYRRRGLASQVMAGLVSWVTGQGATSGFLFASVEGVPLYTRLGWQELAPLASFRGRAGAH